jgi:ABC-type transport system involved in multi-copper enzyme maturation permease subunit
MAQSPELGHSEESTAARIDEVARSDAVVELVKKVTGESKEQTQYLLKEQPALLSAIWLVLLFVFPFMMCLSGFNQTAGEIGSRGLRYLLLRTSRANIFLGRFLGAFLFAAVATALMVGVLVCYIGIKLNVYPLAELLWWGFQGYVALLSIGLAYLALCSWISAMLDSAFGSLALCFAAVGGSILVVLMANAAARGANLDWLWRVIPWGWKFDLLSGDIGTRLVAYAAMLGFTLLFLALGLRTFTKRDL